MDVGPSFPKAWDALLGTPGVSLDLFSQDKGQTIQVLAPQFRLFGTFLPDNENAGAPAICIHRDLFREDAIVTHVVTSQGRDHFFFNFQCGRHSLVIASVHYEP